MCNYIFFTQVFDDDEEETLVDYIIKCSNHYYGLSITELRILAYEFVTKIDPDNNRKYPKSWDDNGIAGYAWYYAFMERHTKLALRTPEQTSLNRVKSFCKENVDAFYRNLKDVIFPKPYPPERIYNMDETGFSTVPSKVGKVISLKGQKRVGKIASAERGSMITMALAVNAFGNSIPPMFLFPSKNMQKHYMDGATPGAISKANESGWMCQDDFVIFMKHYISFSNSSKENPTLLLLDNHGSHLSVEALDLAAENGVTLPSFPPHCSHRMQPLDVSVYGPLKIYYRSECDSFLSQNMGEGLHIRQIAGLVAKALTKALLPSNIINGFRATGIYPFNSTTFGESDFIEATISGDTEKASEVEALYGDEEQRRIVVSSDDVDVALTEEVSTTEPSIPSSVEVSNVSRSESLS